MKLSKNLSKEDRASIVAQAQKVAPERRRGYYRWILKMVDRGEFE